MHTGGLMLLFGLLTLFGLSSFFFAISLFRYFHKSMMFLSEFSDDLLMILHEINHVDIA